jgi:hypothetical protein
MSNDYPYFAIVTFGRPSVGKRRSYYRSLDSARRDLATLVGGSMSNARIVGCDTRAQALCADISDSLPVVSRR